MGSNIPGDFHLMRIYQKVLMNAYQDAELKLFAAASSYRGETLTSLSTCRYSNFTNTTTFLFEIWELYRHSIFHHAINKNEIPRHEHNLKATISSLTVYPS